MPPTRGRKITCRPLRPPFLPWYMEGQRDRGGTLDPKDNHVFVMTDASGFYCIGASRNPKKKVLELRKVNPTIKLVGTRKESHGTAFRQRDRYHKTYAHRRITGQWFRLSNKELVELMGGFDPKSISGAIGQEMAKLKPSIEKRDRTGLERAFRERFDAAYPAMLRPLLERLPDKG